MSQVSVGIVGVGLMGHGIATNIQKSGRTIGFLEHPGNQPTDTLRDNGAVAFATAAELAAATDVIILCVTGSPQVEQVLTQENGILRGMRSGTTIIDCSTAIPSSTRKLAEAVIAAGGQFLDAPMTRTPKEAAEGRLNLIVGGDPALFEKHKPLLQCYAENITHAGGIGAGHTMKLLHNFVSLGYSAVLSEAFAAADKAGVERKALRDVLASGGGAGVVLERMTPFVVDNDLNSFAFSLSNSAKDIGYYNAMCQDLDATNGVAAAVLDAFQTQVNNGNAERYVPELIDLLGKH